MADQPITGTAVFQQRHLVVGSRRCTTWKETPIKHKIKSLAAAALAATAMAGAPVAAATTDVYVLPGTAGYWPFIPATPFSVNGPENPFIDANFYTCGGGCSVTVVPYPRTVGPLFGPNAPTGNQSIAIGVNLTRQGIEANQGTNAVVAGLSLGSLTTDAVQHYYDTHPQGAPPPSQLTFVVSGDLSRPTPVSDGILSYVPAGITAPYPFGFTVARPDADSPYNTTVIVGEYDGWADFPDRPWNLLADANAIAGIQYVHSPSSLSTKPAQPSAAVTDAAGGTTTTYVVPTPELPLLDPLNGKVPQPVINKLNTTLKPIVDRGYSRNDTTNGSKAPFLQPTNGLPKLVVQKPTLPKLPKPFRARGKK